MALYMSDSPAQRVNFGLQHFGAADFTWAAWVYYTKVDTHHAIFGHFGPGGLEFMWLIHTSGKTYVDFLDTGGTERIGAGSNGALSTGTWQHVCSVRDASAGTIRHYVDGVFDAENTGKGSLRIRSNQNSGQFRFWKIDAGSHPMDGRLAEVAMWYDRALTDDEVAVVASGMPRVAAMIHPDDLWLYCPIDEYPGVSGLSLDGKKLFQHASHPSVSSPGNGTIEESDGEASYQEHPVMIHAPSHLWTYSEDVVGLILQSMPGHYDLAVTPGRRELGVTL